MKAFTLTENQKFFIICSLDKEETQLEETMQGALEMAANAGNAVAAENYKHVAESLQRNIDEIKELRRNLANVKKVTITTK